MTKTRLEEIVKAHGMTVDGLREGAGKFRDVIIGTGKPRSDLITLGQILREETGSRMISVQMVTNEDHEQYGQPYLYVESFWWED